MRLRSPRLTIRRLMIAVALFGLILGGSIEWVERGRRFRAAYQEHALAELEEGTKLELLTKNLRGSLLDPLSMNRLADEFQLDAEERRLLQAPRPDLRAMIRAAGFRGPIALRIDRMEISNRGMLGPLLRRVDYHRTLREKYRKATFFPLLPLGPDPVDPGGPRHW